MSRRTKRRIKVDAPATIQAIQPAKKHWSSFLPSAGDFAFDNAMTPEKYAALSSEQRRAFFAPPVTNATPYINKESEDAIAMDAAIDHNMTLVQHAFEWGQSPIINGFIGYPALSGLAQDGLISAGVEVVANDMTREWIELTRDTEIDADGDGDVDNDDAKATDKRKKDLEAAMRKFKVRELVHRAAVCTRYNGGCLVFIDTGETSPDELRKPLDLTGKGMEMAQGKLRGFTVVEPINLSPGIYNSAYPLRKDYMEPEYWYVLGTQVHSSRFIKFTSGNVPDLCKPMYNFFGVPPAQVWYDYVIHFRRNRTSASRLFEKQSHLVVKTMMKDMLNNAAAATALENRLRYIAQTRSNDGIFGIDKEDEDLVLVECSLAGIAEVPRQALEFVSAIMRIPAVKLMGISPSGFNATGQSDIVNYNDHVRTEQEHVLRGPIEKFLQCVQLHVDGQLDQAIGFEFNELGGEDETIQSTIRKTNADALIAMTMGEVFTPEGGRAAILANPEDYPPGFADAIKSDQEALEAAAEEEVDGYGAGEFEEGVAGAESPEESVQSMGMNGAQVTALQGIVMAVAKRELPRDSGVYMIASAFGIDPDEAEKIIGEAGRDFVIQGSEEPKVEGNATVPSAEDDLTPEQTEAVREMKQERENPIKKEERLYASV